MLNSFDIAFIDTRLSELKTFAKNKHAGQKYGNHDYYDYHICNVYDRALTFLYKNFNNPILDYDFVKDVLSETILHDVVEDTDTTQEEILEMTNERVSLGVSVLTKRVGEKRLDNIIRIIDSNSLSALVVKYCDSSENYSNSSNGFSDSLAKEYKKNLKVIRKELVDLGFDL